MPKPYRGKFYKQRYLPDHPLADGRGTVLEHRLVLWNKLEGKDAPCHWCRKPLSWKKRTLCVDHLDEDITNNDPDNLVPACRPCNANRNRPVAQHGTISGYVAGCHQPCCRAEWNRYNRELRARKKRT